jgi:hypothetical protein
VEIKAVVKAEEVEAEVEAVEEASTLGVIPRNSGMPCPKKTSRKSRMAGLLRQQLGQPKPPQLQVLLQNGT